LDTPGTLFRGRSPGTPLAIAFREVTVAMKMLLLAVVLGVAVALVAARDPYREMTDTALRAGVKDAVARRAYPAAVAMTEALIARRVALLGAGEAAVEALLRDGQLARGARLLLAGVRGPKVVQLGDLAHKQMSADNEDERVLLEPMFAFLVEHDPMNADRRARYATLLARQRRLDDARKQCQQALSINPAHVAARNLLWKIKHVFTTREQHGYRKVRFTAKLPVGKIAYLAGSWNGAGQADQLRGWKREAMTPGAVQGDQVIWSATRGLEPGDDWYSALVATSADPAQAAVYLARFPVYATGDGDVRVDLAQHPVAPAHELFARRPDAPAARGVRAPRTVLLCVDGATWKVLMPLVAAGLMPRTAALMKLGTAIELRSSYPLTIPAFNLVNLGVTQPGSPVDLLHGALEVMKEHGMVHGIGDGAIQGRDNLWKALAQQGLSTLYTGLSEQLSYDRRGKETTHQLRVDADATGLAGAPATKNDECVAAFLPSRERASGRGPRDVVLTTLFTDSLRRHYQGLELMKRTDADVTLMHLVHVDTAFHMFWDEMEDHLAAEGAKVTRYGKVIEASHRMLDVMIGEVADQLDLGRDNLIVWSDHGTRGGLLRQQLGHDALGIGIFAGARFKRGEVVGGAPDLARLAPTLCAALRVQAPASHAASPIEEVLAGRARSWGAD
jgi:hypothetical protein